MPPDRSQAADSRPYGLCADRAGRPLPLSGGPALGSARNHADYGPPFDAQASTTDLTSRGPWTASRMDCAGCAVPGGRIRARNRIAAAFAENSDCRHMEHGKQRACVHRSSRRVGSTKTSHP
jgi:hypothetical protein